MTRRSQAAALIIALFGATALTAAANAARAATPLTQVQTVAGGGGVQTASATGAFGVIPGGGLVFPTTYQFDGWNPASGVFGLGINGVLVGATLDYQSTFSVATTTSVSPFQGQTAPPFASVPFTNSVGLTLTPGGVNATASNNFTLGCTGASASQGCSASGSQSQAFDVHQTFTDLSTLQAFASAGVQGVTVTPSVTAASNIFGFDGDTPNFSMTDTATLTPSALSLTYDYLKHGLPSFVSPDTIPPGLLSLISQVPGLASLLNTETLDFSTVTQGSAATLGGTIFNLGDANTDGLQLDGFHVLGTPGPFTLDVPAFSDLETTGSQGFTVGFDTSQLGVFSQQFEIDLSDAGTGLGRDSYAMILTVTGDVVAGAPVTGVPEPAAWALMILGFGAVGASLRARRGVAAV
ncbi:PEPxxWA-CTERM sorting domain-containing protein [Phenylobacterium sp.]|uniref:PEPxxWA-CTERM sorting domain-containing protein n=1 Tax=Phenylobacterium sp. TaxID=1871053 RepID=UPI002F4192E4